MKIDNMRLIMTSDKLDYQCVPDPTHDPLLSMIEEIKLAHQERDKRGPFCFSFGPYDLDEESSDEGEL